MLQYESNSHTNDFINSVISHPFLPYIHQLTRVADHSATVTDNMFSNITDFYTLSGNITSIIADHFAQFSLIKKCHMSYKSCSYFVHDYSNFGKEKFIHDFSLIDGSILDNTDLSANDHFDYFYDEITSCIDLHVPKKQITSKVLMIFRCLCHIEISCLTKWFNLQHPQINIYIPSSGTVLCLNKGEVRLILWLTELNAKRTRFLQATN